jgi:hypothetical protein
MIVLEWGWWQSVTIYTFVMGRYWSMIVVYLVVVVAISWRFVLVSTITITILLVGLL